LKKIDQTDCRTLEEIAAILASGYLRLLAKQNQKIVIDQHPIPDSNKNPMSTQKQLDSPEMRSNGHRAG